MQSHQCHPGVQLYKQAYELTQNMNPEDQCNIALHFDSDTDHRHYNLPTATEFAVILPGDGDHPTNTCDIVLWRRSGVLQFFPCTIPFSCSFLLFPEHSFVMTHFFSHDTIS